MLLLRSLVLAGVVTVGVNGLAPQRQVLVTYPDKAPQSDLNDYKDAIKAGGGGILHEFSLFKHVPQPSRKDQY